MTCNMINTSTQPATNCPQSATHNVQSKGGIFFANLCLAHALDIAARYHGDLIQHSAPPAT